MEVARAFWRMDDLISAVVARVVDTGETVAVAIDAMAPIRIQPQDEWMVLREGIRSLVHERGIREYRRSGKVQSAKTHIRPLAEESAGLDEYFDLQLRRLIFETVDGSMRPVLDFTHEDAQNIYELRVNRPRAQAIKEDSFWKTLIEVTSGGRTLATRAVATRRKLAKLAVEAQLTVSEE